MEKEQLSERARFCRERFYIDLVGAAACVGAFIYTAFEQPDDPSVVSMLRSSACLLGGAILIGQAKVDGQIHDTEYAETRKAQSNQ